MTEKHRSMNESMDFSRRSFLTKLWLSLGGIALAGYASAVVAFMWPRKTGRAGDYSMQIIEAGPVEKFRPNSVTAFVRGKFYLCRFDDGGFLAVSSKCTHLGCSVPWDESERRFSCPCHASAFDISGAVLTSPAPRPLDMYPVIIQNNVVKIDIGMAIRRDRFKASQIVYSREI
jgi:cytochrome b6-f complex iron-sulfur subunit